MEQPYVYLGQLTDEVGEIPSDSILSRTFYRDENLKAILFGFAPGQELSEHTASVPAILHFVQGQARLTLGDDHMQAGPGTWVHMQAGLPHSIYAETPVVMLLLMLAK